MGKQINYWIGYQDFLPIAQADIAKTITRARLFVTTGYYKDDVFIPRPDCLTKVYNRLVRVVKRIAPYTELTDTYISTREPDALQEVEWKHKEYVTPACLELRQQQYKLN